ncbi:7082_t:CDS:2, partial [Gigaspora margarita]
MNSLSTPNYNNGYNNNYDNECSNDYNDYGNNYGNKYNNNYYNNGNDLGNNFGNKYDNDHENDNVSTTSKQSNRSEYVEAEEYYRKKKTQNENSIIENLLKNPKNSSAIKFISIDNIKL